MLTIGSSDFPIREPGLANDWPDAEILFDRFSTPVISVPRAREERHPAPCSVAGRRLDRWQALAHLPLPAIHKMLLGADPR